MRQEVYVPLPWRPGEAAQVDFFEVTVEVAGQRRLAWMFVLHLMYSGRDFACVRYHIISPADSRNKSRGEARYFPATPVR